MNLVDSCPLRQCAAQSQRFGGVFGSEETNSLAEISSSASFEDHEQEANDEQESIVMQFDDDSKRRLFMESGTARAAAESVLVASSAAVASTSTMTRNLAVPAKLPTEVGKSANPGLSTLLDQEAVIFEAVGMMKSRVEQDLAEMAKANTNAMTIDANGKTVTTISEQCRQHLDPTLTTGKWSAWATKSAAKELGNQLRTAMLLLVKGIRPRVMQLQLTKFDSHSEQPARIWGRGAPSEVGLEFCDVVALDGVVLSLCCTCSTRDGKHACSSRVYYKTISFPRQEVTTISGSSRN